jgi:hypothetical protein
MRPSLPVVKHEKRGSPSKEGRKSWAGDEVEIEVNQLLHVDKELMDKLVDTLTQQVYYEKEIAAVIGNLSADGDRVMERMDALEKKHNLDRQRSLRMDGHHFTSMNPWTDWRTSWRL